MPPTRSTRRQLEHGLRSACEPCRRRKIRCSGDQPVCIGCARLGKACEYLPVISSSGYVATLEARIRDLQGSTTQSNGDSPRSATESPQPPIHNDVQRARRSFAMTSPLISSGSVQPYLPSNQQLVQGMPADYEIPWIAGASQQTVVNESITFDRTILPSPDIIEQLVEHYWHCTNSAYPIHHTPTFRKQMLLVCGPEGVAKSIDFCVVLMTLAVAATSLPLSSPLYISMRHKANVFWTAALDHLGQALEGSDIRRLQVQLIQLLYVLYNPNAGRVWDLSGAAIRSAVDLGLHHEYHAIRADALYNHLEVDMRRRLFWTAYCLDRNLAFALGRPPGIADEWITTDMPLSVEDACITPDGVVPGPPSNLKATVLHNIQIRRLQSEIHHRLYMPSNRAPSRDWYVSVLARLHEWRDTMPEGTGFISPEWLNVNFHISMMMLHRPAPANPTPSLEELKLGFASSAQVMRAYKHMHRTGRINFNWLAMYQLFIAGMTYLNSLWQAHRSGWSIVSSYVEAVLDVQVCTGLMEALSALTPGTSGIRDTFESVSEKIIRQLSTRSMGPSRAASPPALGPSAAENEPLRPGYDMDEVFGLNPLDSFLLNPVETHSIEEWELAVTAAFGNMTD